MFSEMDECSPCLVEVRTRGDELLLNNNSKEFSSPAVSHPELPEYTLQSVWFLVWLVGVEYLALWWKGERLPFLHDNILSLVHATLYEVSKLFVRGLEYGVYVWVWKNYSLLSLTWDDSLRSFLILIVLVDFGYYWFHRAAHEIMVLWAFHQVHHSSEEFSVSLGLRHSPIQRLFSWVFYLPLALLGIPPAQMLAHIQFNTLFQLWTHTETIKTVGPLEYVFNTPAHHRIHHGCNLHCLDVNYGGIFIVWDRLFGTFRSALPDQEVVFGIVFQPKEFNPLYHQVFYLLGAIRKAKSMSSWQESLEAMVKGPSWSPGSPWTGWNHNKLDIRGPRDHVPVSAIAATHVYVILHFLTALSLTSYLIPTTVEGPMETFMYGLMVVATLTCIGILYEGSPYARIIELCRCGGSLALCLLLPLSSTTILFANTTIYVLSLLLWILGPHTVVKCKTD